MAAGPERVGRAIRATGTLPRRLSRDAPKAEVHVLGAGHFAIDTAADRIGQLVRDFMK